MLAVGAGVAEPIVAAARAAGVAIVVRRELARAIERAVPIADEIPPGCYAAVADVLAHLTASRGAEEAR